MVVWGSGFVGVVCVRGETVLVVSHAPSHRPPPSTPTIFKRKEKLTGQLHAHLPHLGLVPVGERHDEIMRVRRPRRRLDALAAHAQVPQQRRRRRPLPLLLPTPTPPLPLRCRRRRAIGDVGRDGGGEQRRLLRHQAQLRPEGLDVEVADVGAVEADGPALDVVEPLEEADDGAVCGGVGVFLLRGVVWRWMRDASTIETGQAYMYLQIHGS